MRFLGFSKKDDEASVIKFFDDDFIRHMNDDELVGEFMFTSGQFTRLMENAEALKAEIETRKLKIPKSALSKVVKAEPTAPMKPGIGNAAEFGSGNTEVNLDGSKKDDKKKKDKKAIKGVGPKFGPKYPGVAFVGASPSKLDEVRGEPFTGPVGRTLKTVYIEAMGERPQDVYLTTLVPYHLTKDDGTPRDPTPEEISSCWDAFKAEMADVDPKIVVALGKTARIALGDNADVWVPHPRAINIYGDSGEVGRKLSKGIKTGKAREWDKVTQPSTVIVGKILKTDDEKQIVVGVVMEPNELDTDKNWTTAAEIEEAAHFYMEEFQVVGDEHREASPDTVVVESFIAPVDFTLGSGGVKEGSWVMAMKLNDDDQWELVKSGEFNGFSIGARTKIDPDKELLD